MDYLSQLDTGFLEAEDSDRHANLAIGGVAVVEGPPPSQAEFVDTVATRLQANPRYRQRVRPVLWDLGAPAWVDDSDFDLGHHVHRTALPAPGDEADLFRLVARVMAQRLDRDRPLWECWVIEGLAGDRWAVLTKMHHCMADGVSGAKLFEAICDASLEAVPGDASIGRPASAPRWRALPKLLTSAAALAISPFDQVRLLARGFGAPLRLVRNAVGTVQGMAGLASGMLPAAASPLNGPIGRQRRYAVARASLEDARAISTAFGVTVNDVVLAAITGAMRELLVSRGEQPSTDSVRTLVPVSVRSPDEANVADNRISLMLPFLPVDIADPTERLAAVHARLSALKSGGETEAGHAATSLAEHWPFAPIAWAVRLATRFPQRSIGSVTTNVPGPRHRLHILDRKIVEILPYVPIAMRLRIGIAILSYTDQLTFGITGDYDGAPDIGDLADGIERATADLLAVAGAHRRVPRVPGLHRSTTEVGSYPLAIGFGPP